MTFPSPNFARAHAVLQFASPVARDPARDEIFIAAVRKQFPNVLSRQYLPVEAPPMTPHVVLGSTSSQLAISSVQADFEVRFYGDYTSDFDKALSYVGEKVGAIRDGLQTMDVAVATVGVIANLTFSFRGRDEHGPAAHILSTHLRVAVDETDLQDAFARVAVRLRDTYFVTLTVSNYESRIFERPILPGMPGVLVRPWEGTVDDVGIELTVDINNNLEARTSAELPAVTDKGIAAMTQLLRELVTSAGPTFAETGEISAQALTEVSTV